MRSVKKLLAAMLITLISLSCVACSGLDTLSDNLKGGVNRLGDDIAIGKSNALVTPYQSFEGSRTSDNNAFLATYDAAVVSFVKVSALLYFRHFSDRSQDIATAPESLP